MLSIFTGRADHAGDKAKQGLAGSFQPDDSAPIPVKLAYCTKGLCGRQPRTRVLTMWTRTATAGGSDVVVRGRRATLSHAGDASSQPRCDASVTPQPLAPDVAHDSKFEQNPVSYSWQSFRSQKLAGFESKGASTGVHLLKRNFGTASVAEKFGEKREGNKMSTD